MNFFLELAAEYGLFLLQTLTVVFGALFVVSGIFSASARMKQIKNKPVLKVESLNEFYDELKDKLRTAVEKPERLKKIIKRERKERKGAKKNEARKKRIYLIDFTGDLKASEAETLTNEVNAVLTVAQAEDEVVVKISSPGGMVNTYGLCAGQLKRLRDGGIRLTACVDKVAASGGYLMACVADKIIAAPFAIVGSIGVVSTVPNFHRVLKKYNVDFEQPTSGKYKRTLTLFGKNTKEGREKFQEQLDMTHDLFKNLVREFRPGVDLEKVATGEFWYGRQSKELGLIDAIQTSDDYLMSQKDTAEIFKITYEEKKDVIEKFKLFSRNALARFGNGFVS